MDILVGVDSGAEEQENTPAVELLKRLRFAGARYDVAHAVAPPVYSTWPPETIVTAEVMADLEREEQARAARDLDHVAAELTGTVEGCRRTVLSGSPVERLLHHADETGVELIAVNGSRSGRLMQWLAGSVARGLVIGARQSVLIAKDSPQPLGAGLRLVFATDHSEYATRCAHELLRFNPRGIAQVTVLTSYPADRLHALSALVPDLKLDPAEAVRQTLDQKNIALAKTLAPLSEKIDTLVVPSAPNEAIAQVMVETKADLLILGARGHGLLDRLTLGSVSLHQAMAEPYSVLVMRV